jgi:hypothetical protein
MGFSKLSAPDEPIGDLTTIGIIPLCNLRYTAPSIALERSKKDDFGSSHINYRTNLEA